MQIVLTWPILKMKAGKLCKIKSLSSDGFNTMDNSLIIIVAGYFMVNQNHRTNLQVIQICQTSVLKS